MNTSRWMVVLLLCGCAGPKPTSVGQGPERHFAGVVEKSEAATRGGASEGATMPLMMFGAIGGAVAGLARADRTTRMHVVRLDSGATVTVVSDEEVSAGDCVRVVVNDYSAEPLPWYSYGQARLDRIACAAATR